MTELRYRIFVVDDEEFIRDAARLNLLEYEVETFASAEKAMKALENTRPDLILMDIGLPGIDGVEALERISAKWPEIRFIMITAYEDVQTVVRAMKKGAYDYVVKPLHMDTLKASLKNATESIRLRKELRLMQEQCLRDNLPFFIAQSNTIQSVMEFVGQVAKSPDAPVLILGETGTGKELIASAIHFQSPQYRGELVTVNCAAFPSELLESELFGYEPGAFSGARPGGKAGLVELAGGGTLFLDEVGDMSPSAQAKLLRFLDTGQYYKLGGTKLNEARVRVVSATNRDLKAMVDQGQFRRDLYYRLAMIKVEVPSLEKRPDDIIPMARFFLDEMNRKYQRAFNGFTEQASLGLKKKHYAGNVRELKGMVERAALCGKEPLVDFFDLGLAGEQGGEKEGINASKLPVLDEKGLVLGDILEQVEKAYIREALVLSDKNEAKAAELLGINYHTFRYRKKKLIPE
jgi:DNA-binding NtrC family response regulator